MTEAANHDPVEMIAVLARGMMAERRGRFLDAACGGDVVLRAEVEGRLGQESSRHDTAVVSPDETLDLAAEAQRGTCNSIDSIARGTFDCP